jgi:RHS repeat-associated protein
VHRPLTLLGLAVAALVARNGSAAARGAEVSATVYVGRHFEVRDHDQPVKYVFNCDNRVAHITGSLSANLRLQRWRLQAGWNSVSLFVTATNLHAQLQRFTDGSEPLVQALYRWQPATHDYAVVGAGQNVPAGSVLWLRARTSGVVSVVGNYAEPIKPALPAGGGFVASPGLQSWTPPLPAGVLAWKFEAGTGQWRVALNSDLAAVGDEPPTLAPGDAVFIHADGAVELDPPDPAQSILYYHSDHLGSSSAITDATGALVEETAFHPFGAPRHEERLRALDAHYGFTRNERDRESGLQYVGHRFLHPGLGRWLSPDPLAERGGGNNLYAYVNQNPLKYVDPDGAQITVTPDKPKNPTHYTITMKVVLIDTSSKKFSQTEMNHYAGRIKSSIEKNFTSQPDPKQKVHWTAKVDLRVVSSWSEVKDDDHVFQIVDKLNGAGETTVGGMLMKLRVNRFTQKHPSEVDQTRPENKHYTLKNFTSLEGTANHEAGHAGGLHHDDTHKNLMQQGSVREYDNQTVTQQMIESMWKAYQADQLNKPQRELIDLRKSK